MTFSIAARCLRSRMLGVAIASSSPAVGARCAHVRAGIGAVATQNVTDPALGPVILARLAAQDAAGALRGALDDTPFAAYRQLVVVPIQGPPAVHSGSKALGLAGTAIGRDSAAAGNLLARADVPDAMVAAFEEAAEGHLGAKLLAALRAGVKRGGEAGPIRSAALLVAHELSWPLVDLRVDWNDDPVSELDAAWDVYCPQIADYVRRALDPAGAPAFGVPGDLEDNS